MATRRRTASATISLLLLASLSLPARAEDWIIGEAQALPPSNVAPSGPYFQFAIPPQQLALALNSFGAQTGTQILYDARIAKDRSSPGASGTMSALVALQKLLSGTGLAAVETFHNGYTLVLNPNTVTLAKAPPPGTAVLNLDPLHVDAPDQPQDHRQYAMTVGYAIRNALLRDPRIRNDVYNADMFVWLTPSGAVQQSSIYISTGRPFLDTAIARAVRGISVGQSPPSGLPQPVHIRLSQLTEH